jgi:uncharacterized membrane protein YhaH (DUF805 family)
MKSIKFHFGHLFSFAGRESRDVFWPYVAGVIVVSMAAMMAVMVPIMASTFSRMRQFAIEHPDQATITRGPASYSISIEGNHPELVPDFGGLIGGIAIATAIAVILLAAAVARRLHDRGRSGFWGLMPLPFLASGFLLMPRLFKAAEPDFSLFGYLFLNNLIYLAALGTLVVLLAGAGEPRDNRYGPFPPQ